ncbi:ExeM/NucH family extracellular endonuclease, partial [Corynebacterium bovis]|uniref:ExeM/NucH family extracellular endonuclease n=1 Tax=Corynebacterium bovis TaxID=36808 RepID=UPI003138F96D
FVELYNPTDHPVSLDGWTLQYFPATASAATADRRTALHGTVAPHGYYLVAGAAGAGGTVDLTADVTDPRLAMGGRAGTVVLMPSDALFGTGAEPVDVVGVGRPRVHEGRPGPAVSNTTSASRDAAGTDTDDNAADLTVGAPTPRYSGGDATAGAGDGAPGTPGTPPAGSPGDPATPTTPADPADLADLADPAVPTVAVTDIQGTGDSSPLVGRRVRTAGIVTATYPDGGLDGLVIQTGGPGRLRHAGEASPGVFVYTGPGRAPGAEVIGRCAVVVGEVAEFHEQTQVAGTATVVDPSTEPGCAEPVTPVTDPVPEDPADREANESTLVQPAAPYTVTDNYALDRYGSVSLVDGDRPLPQATSVAAPGAEAAAVEEANRRRVLTLDDGATRDFRSAAAAAVPLPYLASADGIRSLRTGDHVRFTRPAVFGFTFGSWSLQPTTPVTGLTPRAELPVSWDDGRAAEVGGPAPVGGSDRLASVNVLNYFTDLGADEPGCRARSDRTGAPVTADRCTVRGAYTPEARADQQAKIVAAVNGLGASVVGLEEVENSAAFGHDRDEALTTLVDALNAAGGTWRAVPSPAPDHRPAPEDEDVIRTALIYNPERVTPVGESRILDSGAFTGIARQPLAQEFAPAGGGDPFVVSVNHFKSKGSVARGDRDTGDGQGANARLRVAQAEALRDWLAAQEDWRDTAQFIIGDLNSYAREDSVTTLLDAGFTNVEERYGAGESYLFGGRVGSLDHVLANARGLAMTTGADVWDINADESPAFEYSRRRANAVDFYAPDMFRASDHDPVVVGLALDGDRRPPAGPGEPGAPAGSVPGSAPGSAPGSVPVTTPPGSGAGSGAGSVVGSLAGSLAGWFAGRFGGHRR